MKLHTIHVMWLSTLWMRSSTASIARRNSAWLKTRGGDDSLYELNPNYQPTGRDKARLEQPFLRHEFYVETTTHQQQSFLLNQPPTFHGFRSVLDGIQRYFWQLYRTSPDLFSVSVTSVLIFFMWQIPGLQSGLQKHFICSRRNLRAGRIHVALTSAVSHFSLVHLVFNLVALLQLGPPVKTALRATTHWPLWPLLMGSAVTGSLSHTLFGRRDGCLGLSGVTLALFGMLARLDPQRIMSIRLMGIFPVQMTSDMMLRVLLIWSLLGSCRTNTDIAHVSHLGGILFGLAYHQVWIRQRRSRVFWATTSWKR